VTTLLMCTCLHVDRLIEAEHAISPKITIHAVRCCLPTRHCDSWSGSPAAILRRICNIGDEDKAGRLDGLNECGRKSLLYVSV
jgi:hypothetical protein